MFGTTRGGFWLPFVFFMQFQTSVAQVNITGKKGLMLIPTAEATTDGQVSLGRATVPAEHSFYARNRFDDHIYYANLTFIPRLEINFILIRAAATTTQLRQGLGDRQLDMKYLLAKETKWRPSVAVLFTFPFSIFPPVSMNALVATKQGRISEAISWQATLGYNAPFVLYRTESNLNNSRFYTLFAVKRKDPTAYGGRFLLGEFGGVKVSYRHKVGVMGEWDGQKVNIGAYAVVGQRLTLQAALLAGKQLGWGVTYQTPLRRE